MSARREIRRAARGLLVESIARYRAALEASERITLRAADPEAAGDRQRWAALEAAGDRQRWAALEAAANNAWDMAEVALAGCIELLYDEVAAPGSRAREDTSPWFVPRAVRHRGWIYILTAEADAFDSRHRVVAMLRESMSVPLARRKPRARGPVHGETGSR